MGIEAPLVLGIDAGNTKTIAVISDTSGQVLGWGRAGQSNIYVSEQGALKAIDQAVSAALGRAGVNSGVAALTLSATGADWPEDFTFLAEALNQRRWAERQQVVNDAVGALRAGSLAGLGVAVACGTSAGIAARSPAGQIWHSSYWQEPEGADELARLALRAVYRAALGIGAQTSLSERIPAFLDCAGAEQVLHLLTGRDQPVPTDLGRLARLLLDEAEADDAVSRELVYKHGAALGDYALAAARQVGLTGPYLLVTSGGVMRHPSPLLRQALMQRVHESNPEVQWQASRHEPVFGAVLLALELLNAEVTETVLERLDETCPEPTLFQT